MNIFQKFGYGLLLFLWSLSVSITLTILISPFIYDLFIELQDLSSRSGYNHQQLKDNYDYLIHYLLSFKVGPFSMPYFTSSSGGAIHFQEVRQLTQMNLVFSLAMTPGVLWLLGYIKSRRLKYQVRGIFTYLQLLPLFILFMIIIAFDQLFVFFHQVLFNNDLWIFNPAVDPVINVLPQSFFMVLFLVAILLYEVIILGLKFLISKLY